MQKNLLCLNGNFSLKEKVFVFLSFVQKVNYFVGRQSVIHKRRILAAKCYHAHHLIAGIEYRSAGIAVLGENADKQAFFSINNTAVVAYYSLGYGYSFSFAIADGVYPFPCFYLLSGAKRHRAYGIILAEFEQSDIFIHIH